MFMCQILRELVPNGQFGHKNSAGKCFEMEEKPRNRAFKIDSG